MKSLSIAVVGGGVAGLAGALALARAGHHITLIERDELFVGGPAAAIVWARPGIGHFLQPHAFFPRGRLELRTTFPDVFDALLGAGAWDVDMRPKIRGEHREQDDELAYLAARRPLIEWALRRSVLAEPGIRVLSGVRATGYDGDQGDIPISRPLAR